MTIQKLVEPMGISTKTVYKYFANKEDLLKECISLQYARLFEKFAVIQNDKSSPIVKIFGMLHEGIKTDFGSNHIFYYDLNYYYPQLPRTFHRMDAPGTRVHRARRGISKSSAILIRCVRHGYILQPGHGRHGFQH